MSNKEGLDMDNLFKALLIIILVAFLYLYYENSNNGRYINYRPEYPLNMLDTKTGKLYIYDSVKDKIILYDFPNATIRERDVHKY